MGDWDAPIDKTSTAIRGAARAIYRVVPIKWVIDTGLVFLQAFGHGDPDDADNQELCQEDNCQLAQHYGFVSRIPTGDPDVIDAVVLEADGADVSVAERYNLESIATHGSADAVPTINDGDVCLYSKDGTYIFIDADGKLTIKAMTDNVEIITESGKQIKLGQDGATYRDIAYAHNTEAGASKVASGTELASWTDKVKRDIAAIKTDLDGLRANMLCVFNNAADLSTVMGAGPVSAVCVGPHVITLSPYTGTDIPANTDHSYVSSGSDKAEVEP